MNLHELWEKALKSTEIIRPRVLPLETFQATRLPYIFLSESQLKSGETTVRKGEVLVEKPSLLLPFNLPQFEGFDFESAMRVNEDFLKSFFLVRGVSFPSLKYNNKAVLTAPYAGDLKDAIHFYRAKLQEAENVHTGLVMGTEDSWQFSILIFIGQQMMRSVDGDFQKLFEDARRRGLMS